MRSEISDVLDGDIVADKKIHDTAGRKARIQLRSSGQYLRPSISNAQAAGSTILSFETKLRGAVTSIGRLTGTLTISYCVAAKKRLTSALEFHAIRERTPHAITAPS